MHDKYILDLLMVSSCPYGQLVIHHSSPGIHWCGEHEGLYHTRPWCGCCWKCHLLQACLSANSGNHPSQRWDSVQKLPAEQLLETVAAGTDLLIMFHCFLDHQDINHES